MCTYYCKNRELSANREIGVYSLHLFMNKLGSLLCPGMALTCPPSRALLKLLVTVSLLM